MTETAFANSCCSVFHSSIVKVLSSMQYMLRNKIGLVLGPLKQGQPHAGTTHLGRNHWEGVTTRSQPLVFINHRGKKLNSITPPGIVEMICIDHLLQHVERDVYSSRTGLIGREVVSRYTYYNNRSEDCIPYSRISFSEMCNSFDNIQCCFGSKHVE